VSKLCVLVWGIVCAGVSAGKGIGLEVNVDKAKSMVMPRDRNERPSHNMKIDNSSFESVESVQYSGRN
jgi:hypothetical protein